LPTLILAFVRASLATTISYQSSTTFSRPPFAFACAIRLTGAINFFSIQPDLTLSSPCTSLACCYYQLPIFYNVLTSPPLAFACAIRPAGAFNLFSVQPDLTLSSPLYEPRLLLLSAVNLLQRSHKSRHSLLLALFVLPEPSIYAQFLLSSPTGFCCCPVPV
jgi:hypothetical protein